MNRYFYIAFLPLHVFLLISLYNFEKINLIWSFVFWVLLSGYGVGVTLHRLLSHRAFKTTETISNILSLLSCFCIQGSPIFWVNIHRGYHHRYSDTEKDIHSPVNGKLWAYFLWSCKIKIDSISYKFVPDLIRSRFHLLLSKYYFYIIWSGWVVAWMVSPTIFYSLVVAQVITMHLEFCVNLFCHTDTIPFGYRNFDTKDNSRNYWLFGLLCWGIGYHNNHHARPKEISFGYTKFEFDPTTILVKTVQKN